MPSESRQIAFLFTALDHRTIARSSIRLALRNRYSRQRAAASDKLSSVARTIARIQAESCQRPGHRSSSVSMQIQKRAFPISMTRRTEQSREREREREEAAIERVSWVPATFSGVHTEAREQTREHAAVLKLRRNGSSSLRKQHGNKLYCGNALDRIRYTPLRVTCWREGGEKGERVELGSELNKPDWVHSEVNVTPGLFLSRVETRQAACLAAIPLFHTLVPFAMSHRVFVLLASLS